MPYVNKPRPYKKEYDQQQTRGELDERMERQRARRKIDKTGADKNNNGKADRREGQDVAHVKALSKGGSNKNGVKIQSPSKNRSFKRNPDGSMKEYASTERPHSSGQDPLPRSYHRDHTHKQRGEGPWRRALRSGSAVGLGQR